MMRFMFTTILFIAGFVVGVMLVCVFAALCALTVFLFVANKALFYVNSWFVEVLNQIRNGCHGNE